MGNKEEKNNTVPNGSTETTGRRHKSARPGRISYVPINDEDLAPYEPPVRKKYKGLKITGIAVASQRLEKYFCVNILMRDRFLWTAQICRLWPSLSKEIQRLM